MDCHKGTILVLCEVLNSVIYTAFIRDCTNFGIVSDGCTFIITMIRNIITVKERTVTVVMQFKNSLYIQGGTCPKVTNCGHLFRHIFSLCVLLDAQFSVQNFNTCLTPDGS